MHVARKRLLSYCAVALLGAAPLSAFSQGINGIDSRAEAVECIESIVAEYGDAPWVEELASAMSEEPTLSGESPLAEATIEIGLVGVAGASVDTGADYML